MALDEDMALIGRQPLLGLLPAEALRLVAFAAETRILRTGDILFRKGDRADAGYLVVSGAVALDARDDGAAGMQVAGAGALIGETALFAETIRPATALARETTSVMRITRHVMRRVLTEFPDGAEALRGAIAGRVRALTAEMMRAGRPLDQGA
jgi:CRP-like cAMP-binding protein